MFFLQEPTVAFAGITSVPLSAGTDSPVSAASSVRDSAGTDEDIPAFDVPDDALEHAAGVTNGRVVTIAVCTHWYHCGLPL